jgi:hypothetical protein
MTHPISEYLTALNRHHRKAAMPDTRREAMTAVAAAIRQFDFGDYGLDIVDPNSEYAEWVPDLASAIVSNLPTPVSAPDVEADNEQLRARLDRVIALHETWTAAGPPPLGTLINRWWDLRLAELRQALTKPGPADA